MLQKKSTSQSHSSSTTTTTTSSKLATREPTSAALSFSSIYRDLERMFSYSPTMGDLRDARNKLLLLETEQQKQLFAEEIENNEEMAKALRDSIGKLREILNKVCECMYKHDLDGYCSKLVKTEDWSSLFHLMGAKYDGNNKEAMGGIIHDEHVLPNGITFDQFFKKDNLKANSKFGLLDCVKIVIYAHLVASGFQLEKSFGHSSEFYRFLCTFVNPNLVQVLISYAFLDVALLKDNDLVRTSKQDRDSAASLLVSSFATTTTRGEKNSVSLLPSLYFVLRVLFYNDALSQADCIVSNYLLSSSSSSSTAMVGEQHDLDCDTKSGLELCHLALQVLLCVGNSSSLISFFSKCKNVNESLIGRFWEFFRNNKNNKNPALKNSVIQYLTPPIKRQLESYLTHNNVADEEEEEDAQVFLIQEKISQASFQEAANMAKRWLKKNPSTQSAWVNRIHYFEHQQRLQSNLLTNNNKRNKKTHPDPQQRRGVVDDEYNKADVNSVLLRSEEEQAIRKLQQERGELAATAMDFASCSPPLSPILPESKFSLHFATPKQLVVPMGGDFSIMSEKKDIPAKQQGKLHPLEIQRASLNNNNNNSSSNNSKSEQVRKLVEEAKVAKQELDAGTIAQQQPPPQEEKKPPAITSTQALKEKLNRKKQ